MLTPRFSCAQTDNSVNISIYVPSVRASDVEIHVEGSLFSLHINPYFLTLHLPHAVLEDENSSALYDPSSGYLNVTLTKEVPGQEFEDLDLLSKLLTPRSDHRNEQHPVIEVIDSKDDEIALLTENTERLSLEQEHKLFPARNDWQFPQQLPEAVPPQLATSHQRTYGFLDMHSGYFRHVTYTENEANELGPDAETLGQNERRRRGEERVNKKFDEEYYLADFVNDEEIRGLIRWQYPYALGACPSHGFTEEQKLTMLRLPQKEYLPTVLQTRSLYLTLVTLLFSNAYDTRTTLADPTSESAWTISVLTPAFASLSPPSPALPIYEALVPSYKRALAFPLYRSFALCNRCKLDVADVLEGGRRVVVKVLLGMKDILDRHDVYYLYSKVWVDDFCVWVQSQASDEMLQTLAIEVRAAKMEKQMLGWDLDELEIAANEAMDRDSDSDDEDEVESMTPGLL
ncbi:SHQ1-domain-containing protein [Gautieria morchelliformis]|nr:SHQ1-domain-containing protein [Gautieria morchelliformis]